MEKPLELAQWVLADGSFSPAEIRAAMEAGEERHVALTEPIPVYVVYQTVWVDDDGTVRFLPDVYGHDQAQLRLLPREAPSGETTLAGAPGAPATEGGKAALAF